MGVEHLFYFQIRWDSQNEFEIEISSSVKLPKTSIFTPPYLRDGSYGDEEKENAKLFEAYYRFLKLNPDNILTKWHKRVVSAGSSYYYIYGLMVAIAIESLLRKYYPKEEKDVAIEPRDVQKEISSLGEEIDDNELRERIIKICSQLRKPDYIPKKMLQKLEVEGIISPGSSKSWDRLRNKYSHGNDDNNEMKHAYRLISCCLNTYYELIFNIIGYSGYYINYSIKHGSERRHYPLSLSSCLGLSG